MFLGVSTITNLTVATLEGYVRILHPSKHRAYITWVKAVGMTVVAWCYALIQALVNHNIISNIPPKSYAIFTATLGLVIQMAVTYLLT